MINSITLPLSPKEKVIHEIAKLKRKGNFEATEGLLLSGELYAQFCAEIGQALPLEKGRVLMYYDLKIMPLPDVKGSYIIPFTKALDVN